MQTPITLIPMLGYSIDIALDIALRVQHYASQPANIVLLPVKLKENELTISADSRSRLPVGSSQRINGVAEQVLAQVPRAAALHQTTLPDDAPSDRPVPLVQQGPRELDNRCVRLTHQSRHQHIFKHSALRQ
ncbi:MAG: hypothetical protein Ct9H300mP25_02280 [Acidobacteriota bacterium]|nr:MAG: hypothetical protein Ct9H300mP25_02280 [Acidobacteriota bacterium]